MACAAESAERTWHADEESFAESLGAIFMQALEARERRRAFAALEASQKKLAAELAEAADYVHALLPAPRKERPSADWIFVPSAELGGDAFGYHWLDSDHFAIYLLDVCGHGVGAALLSISALNVLRNGSVPGVDFHEPAQVLAGMNRTFEMERQNNMYFTLWYGVWNRENETLACSCGGHSPALLYAPHGPARPEPLGKPGLVVGAMPDVPFATHRLPAPAGSTLLVFSDGVFEVTQPDGTLWTLEAFGASAATAVVPEGTPLEAMVDQARRLRGQDELEDDFSLLRIRF